MSVHQLLIELLQFDLSRSLEIFAPELVLCLTIISLLLIRMTGWSRQLPMQAVALVGAMLVFVGLFSQFMYLRGAAPEGTLQNLFRIWCLTAEGCGTPGIYFTGLMTHDLFSVFLRLGLSLFLVLFVAMTILCGVPDNEDAQDFYTLVLGAMLGMFLAVGANHLLMIFLAVEMMSLPSYLLVAFQKGRRQASEAALKYVVYGAGAAGVMLYGLSLIAGLLGTAELPVIAERVRFILEQGSLNQSSATGLTLLLGILLVLVGLSFKLALVPFHFWCPDAFEGALAEIGAFLSIASKLASFALLVRFVIAFHGPGLESEELCLVMGLALGVLGIITTTYGNLAAYWQTNLKRMLAYSTIAQAGYTVMAVSAFLTLLSAPAATMPMAAAKAAQCLEGMIYYLAVYLFMNLSAFACVALIRNQIFSEEILDYRGLFTGNAATRLLCICLALSFFSLIGIPPMAGAFGKFMIFSSLFTAGNVHWFLWVVLAFGTLNSVVSVFYYVRVLKAIFFSEPLEGRARIQISGLSGLYVVLVTLPLLLLGASPLMADLSATARSAAMSLLP